MKSFLQRKIKKGKEEGAEIEKRKRRAKKQNPVKCNNVNNRQCLAKNTDM